MNKKKDLVLIRRHKKDMKQNKENIKKAGIFSMLVLGAIAAVVMLASVHDTVERTVMFEKRMPTLVTGDADPGDNSGFFYFMVYPHQADPATAYASNLSNATAYEFSDVGNTSCTGETPYSTTFDLVIKVGVTDDDGYYTSNGTRNPDYNWCLLTCSDLSIGADTNMTEVFIGNNTDYAWYHYYLNNGGAGYTIIEGESFNVTSVKFYVQRIV